MAVTYTGPTTIALSPASLASSSTFVTGRESGEIDNTVNLYEDVEIQGFSTTGTSPAADTNLRLYIWGSHTALGTTPLDVLDGTDSNVTMSSPDVRDSILVLARLVQVDSTSDAEYQFKPFSVAQIFGSVPQYWGLFLSHDTGVNLNSTAGNHEFKYTGIKYS